MANTKKLTAFLIALAVVFAAFSFAAVAPAYAEADVVTLQNDCFTYDQTDAAVITGLNVPEEVTGKYAIVIPDGVTAIADEAFKDSENLAHVTLNNGLTSIGGYAFTGASIETIDIPASVAAIGAHAFDGCVHLGAVNFAPRTSSSQLAVSIYAFRNCTALKTVTIPDRTTVSQFAFEGCSSLLWAYIGSGCHFYNTAEDDLPNAVFFPTNTAISIVFPSQEEYNATINQTEQTFNRNNGKSATYVVNVNCYVGQATAPQMTYVRLHGRQFNYVQNSDGMWNVDTAYSVLPAQDATYAQTVWYTEQSLTNVVTYADVCQMLETDREINLYCHETVLAPSVPTEPVSWMQTDDKLYDSAYITEVLQAMGCQHNLTPSQLEAIDFSVTFADEKGETRDTPQAIGSAVGAYNVTLSLDPAYGSWINPVTSSVTVNADTRGVNITLIVLLVVGTVAMVVTASTAIIRQKVQERSKKKQLTQKEIMEKFRAAGGKSDIIK